MKSVIYTPMHARAAVAGLFLFCAVGIAHGQDAVQKTLHPGDAIAIDVWRNPELSGQFVISGSGRIQHPLYQDIEITTVPLPQVPDTIRQFLGQFASNPQVSVIPLLGVIVTGEVRNPNKYYVPSGTSVSGIIAMAGGVTERGNINDVHINRKSGGGRVDHSVDSRETSVLSGDEVIINSRRPNILREFIGPIASVVAAIGVAINAFSK